MWFAYRRQPVKSIYTAWVVILNALKLFVWIGSGTIPAWRHPRSWSLKRIVIVKMFRALLDFMFATDFSLLTAPAMEHSAAHTRFIWIDPAPDLVVGEVKEMADKNGVEALKTGGFWYGPTGAASEAGQKAEPDEMVIYNFHGGAYIMGTGAPSDPSMATTAEGFQKYLSACRRIFALEYRLASASPFPSANAFPACLVDAIAGYRYLVEDVGFAPENIILAGDSAGGGLAFGLAYYLHKHRDTLSEVSKIRLDNAGGIILISPTADWTRAGDLSPGHSMFRNWSTDYVYPILASGYTLRALAGSLPEEAVTTNVYLSPGSRSCKHIPGMFTGMPRTCIIAGGLEQTLDPMLLLRDRLREDMGEGMVTYIEEESATHDCVALAWHEPERTAMLKRTADWLQADTSTSRRLNAELETSSR